MGVRAAGCVLWGLAGLAAGVAAAHVVGAEATAVLRERTTWLTWAAVLGGAAALVSLAAIVLASWQARFAGQRLAAFDARRLCSLVFVLAIALGYSLFSWERLAQAAPAAPAQGSDVLTFPGGTAQFTHPAHMERIGFDQCGVCHHAAVPDETTTRCSRCHADLYLPTRAFNHAGHEVALGAGSSCGQCHPEGQPHSAPVRVECVECHATGGAASPWAPRYASTHAPALRDAAHKLCVGCHRREAERSDAAHAHLPRCATCHPGNPAQELPAAR